MDASKNTSLRRDLDKEIEQCREHAAHCALQAETAHRGGVRADFLRLEKSWLQLARSYEVARGFATQPDNPAGSVG